MISIRQYQQKDKNYCLDIFDSNLPKFFAHHERSLFQSYLEHIKQDFYVIEYDGQVHGCGGFRVDDYGISYLAWGMLGHDHHGKGLGARLLEFRLDRIKHIAHAWCVLIDTSQHTAPFFAHHGFKEFRTIKNGYEPGLDKIHMRLAWLEN